MTMMTTDVTLYLHDGERGGRGTWSMQKDNDPYVQLMISILSNILHTVMRGRMWCVYVSCMHACMPRDIWQGVMMSSSSEAPNKDNEQVEVMYQIPCKHPLHAIRSLNLINIDMLLETSSTFLDERKYNYY